jgi:hypothetical protein
LPPSGSGSGRGAWTGCSPAGSTVTSGCASPRSTCRRVRRPVNVLSHSRSVRVAATLNAARAPGRVKVTAVLMDRSRAIAAASTHAVMHARAPTVGLGCAASARWGCGRPSRAAYPVRVTVHPPGGPHTMTVRPNSARRCSASGSSSTGSGTDLRAEPAPAVPVHRDGGVNWLQHSGTPRSCATT